MSKMFNKCENLINLDISKLDFSKVSKMIALDTMNFNQIQWCKKRGIIQNLKPDVANNLNMSAFYAVIESDLIVEFESL